MPLVKRIFDILASGLGLVILSPFLLILHPLVWAFHGSPVLFRQQRPGYKGRPFVMFKFRTMTNKTSADGKLLPDLERMTKLGRFLRSTSFDEVPESTNVFRGEMSLAVSPLLMKYLPLTPLNKSAVMMCYLELRVGLKLMVEIASLGRKNSSWTYGMWTIGPSGWIYASYY